MKPPLTNKALFGLAGLGLAYLALGYGLDAYYVPRHYRAFHAARLRGTISQRATGKLRVSLRLNNDARTYYLFPCDRLGNCSAATVVVATAPGDSVYKAGGSDTLYVVARGRRHVFIGEQPR